MNKLFTKIAALALGATMAVGVGVAVASNSKAAEPAHAASSTSSGSVTASNGALEGWSGTVGSKYSDGSVKFGTQGNNLAKTNIFSGTVSSNMTKLEVTFEYKINGSGTMTNNAMSVTPYVNGSYGSATAVSGFSSTSKTTKTITVSSGLTNCTGFKITYSTKQNGNLGLYSLSWVATYETGGSSVTLSVNPNSLDLDLNDSDTFNVSISATGEYGTEFIVESGDESVATVSPDTGDGNTTITVSAVGVGDTTITVSSLDGDQTATVDVSVTQPFVSKNYVLCTSTNDLTAGSSYLITNGTSGTVKTMASSVKGNNRDTVDATISNNKIASTSSMLSVTLGGSEGAWTFHTDNYAGTAGYLNATSTTSDNYLKVVSTLDNYAYFAISFSNSASVITCTGKNSRNVIRNNSALISCYTSGYNDVYLWKENDGTSLTLDAAKHLDYVGHDFELTATADGYTPSSWTWSSSPSGIVTISNVNGVATVTPVGAGATTITVSAPNGATPKTATCPVTITSQSGADTSHLLTIDDAILIANYTGSTHTESSYYLEGTVTSLFSSKYPILLGTSATLEVYVDCSGTVYAEDTIRVHGPIFCYSGSQAEFDNTSSVSLINIPVDSVTVTNPTPIPTSVDDGDLSEYLTVTINGTNSRAATNQGWKVLSSSDTNVIDISGADGKTFDSGSSAGTTTLTIASTADNTKTATISVTTIDASTPVLQSVTVSGTPSKSTQYVGQEFVWTGLTFTPVYDPVKEPVESIDGDDIVWNALVAGQNPTGTYTGDNDVSVTVTVTSVTVEEDGINAVYVSGDMSKKTYDEDASWNYSGLVVKVTYKSAPGTQVDPSSAVTWRASSTPKQLGVGTGKSVNVYATVGEVESSAYLVSDITVTEHTADKYGEYTGAITAGQYVIVGADSYAMKNVLSSDRFANDQLTISSGIIEDPAAAYVWNIEQNGNYWTIYNSAISKYAAGQSAKNKGALIDDVTDLARWTITYNGGYVFDNLGRHSQTDTPNNAYLRQNSTISNGWACYAASTGTAPSLYKLNYLPKAFDHFDYVDGTPDKTSYMVGETFDPAGLRIDAVYTEPSIYPQENITNEIVWDALVEGTTATGTWSGETVTITGLTITAFTPATYTKLTSIDQLAVGSEVIIGGYKTSSTTYYVLNGFSSDHFTAETTTATSSTMTTTSETLIFTVEADRNGYYFKNGNNYIKRSNSDSAFGAKDSNACWGISFGEEGAVTMTNGDSGATKFQFNDSSPRFKNYAGTQKDIYIYIKEAASETDILKTFTSRYLLLENETLNQIPSSPTGVSGTDCLGIDGPYRTAKAALTTGDFSSHLSNFQSSSDTIVTNARLRYESWARAYGDTTPYANSVGNSRVIINGIISNSNGGTIAIVVVTSVISLTAIGGYFFLRKRREQN